MASGKAGDRSGPTSNPKQPEMQEPDDDDDFFGRFSGGWRSEEAKETKQLIQILKPGGFRDMKAEDRKGRLEKRRAKN